MVRIRDAYASLFLAMLLGSMLAILIIRVCWYCYIANNIASNMVSFNAANQFILVIASNITIEVKDNNVNIIASNNDSNYDGSVDVELKFNNVSKNDSDVVLIVVFMFNITNNYKVKNEVKNASVK